MLVYNQRPIFAYLPVSVQTIVASLVVVISSTGGAQVVQNSISNQNIKLPHVVISSDKKGVYVPYDPDSIGINGLNFETRLTPETLKQLRTQDDSQTTALPEPPPLAGRLAQSAKPIERMQGQIAKEYQLKPVDRTIRAALGRWIKEEGYQDLVWDLRDDIPVEREAVFHDDLLGAIESVMVALRLSALPARACVYTNKVVRIIPSTRFCTEPE